MAKARRTVTDRKEFNDGSVEFDLSNPAPSEEPRREEPQPYGTKTAEPEKKSAETVVVQQPSMPAEPTIDEQRDNLKKRQQAADNRLKEEREARLAAENARIIEANKHRIELESTQLDSVANALEARKATAAQAKTDYIAARQAGDIAAEAEALDRMQKANSDISTLESGKSELERTVEQRKKTPPQVQQAPANVEQILAQMPQLTHEERDWIRKHPDSVTDQGQIEQLRAAYNASQKRGITRGSPEYFKFMDERLGYTDDADPMASEYEDDDMDDAPPPVQRPQPETRQRQQVAAPPSRSSPGVQGRHPVDSARVTLDPQQREAAKFSGISERDYAENLAKLRNMKRKGYYQEVG